MFRRMRDSKGEAAVKEQPVAVVSSAAAEAEVKETESARSLVSSRLKLNGGASAMPATEVDGDTKRRRRLLNFRVDLHRKLFELLNLSEIKKVSEQELRREIGEITHEELATSDLVLSRPEFENLVKELVDEVTGLGPLEPLLADNSITDILVNTYSQCYVERHGMLELSPVQFKDNAHLMRVINKIRFTVDRLIETQMFSEEMALFMHACVRTRLNILISGGTGSGKTTTLNALSSFIPNEERIVTIEDTAELQLQQEHVGRMESRPANIEGTDAVNIRDLVRNALRMRPDRIVVGEMPRRRGDRHVAGHEHWPRRIDDHDPRQQPARRARPYREHDRHVRHRAAAEGGADQHLQRG